MASFNGECLGRENMETLDQSGEAVLVRFCCYILEDGAVIRDWKRYKLFEETSHSTIGYTKLCQSAFVCQLSKSVELKFLDRVCAGGDWCWSS